VADARDIRLDVRAVELERPALIMGPRRSGSTARRIFPYRFRVAASPKPPTNSAQRDLAASSSLQRENDRAGSDQDNSEPVSPARALVQEQDREEATSTTLNLWIGATFDASPISNARK